MDTELLPRAYRKTINSQGWLYLSGEMRTITLKNISLSGAMVQLEPQDFCFDNQQTLENLALSKTVDFFLPQLQLSGTANAVRVAVTEDLHIMLGMAFQDLIYCVNEAHFKRKSYRAAITIPGRLFLNGEWFDFMTVNMSSEGLMIRFPIIFGIDKGMVVKFEFTRANLKGWVKVVWTLDADHFETFIGLQYVKPKPKTPPLKSQNDSRTISSRQPPLQTQCA